VIALGPTLLGVLGRSYAVGAIGLLIVLTASAVPDAITNVAVTVKRADGRFRQAATINAAIAIICLVGAWLAVPSEGAIGAAGAWVVAQIAGALVVAVMALRLPRRSVAAA
jgi:O-antigen/teichoic acid export membrane protein